MCSWMFKLSEWANFSSYDVGLRSGSTASHILVCFISYIDLSYSYWCVKCHLLFYIVYIFQLHICIALFFR